MELFGLKIGIIIGNLAYLLIALSMLATDILIFRMISCTASFTVISYGMFFSKEVDFIALFWNALFLSINLTQIFLLVKEKRAVSFTEEEEELYRTVFDSLSRVEFMKLLKIGRWEKKYEDYVLTVQNEDVTDIMLIYNGLAEVEIDRQVVAKLSDGAIIGEMSYITGLPATATVRLVATTKFIVWKQEDLRSFLKRNPAMYSSMQAVFSIALSRKLSKKNKEKLNL